MKFNTNILCAGGYSNRSICPKAIDITKFDAGGPLTYWNNQTNQHILIGVASWVKACGRKDVPSVFVKISKLRKWIHEKMKNPIYCKNPSSGFGILGSAYPVTEEGKKTDLQFDNKIYL